MPGMVGCGMRVIFWAWSLAALVWAWAMPSTGTASELRLDGVEWPASTPPEEGRTVLLRLRGSGLTSELGAEFVADGRPVGVIREWVGRGSEAALRFEIPVLTDLGGGDLLNGELRVRGADGVVAATPLTIRGLPEFVLGAGQRRVFTTRHAARFSTIVIEAGAVVEVGEGGSLNWESTGPVVIDGEIDARGADGADAVLDVGGVAGSTGGAGGRGGLEQGDRAPTAGGGGSQVIGPARRSAVEAGPPWGAGGAAGHNGGVETRSPCTDFPRTWTAVGGSAECVDEIRTLLRYDRMPADHSFDRPMLAGAQGFGARNVKSDEPRPRPGHGGGGGGGGGEDDVFGGGGGAGGEGGRGVRIVGGANVRVRGRVVAEGGNGGRGWKADSTVPLPVEPDLYDLAYSGGGGGGGAGGELILVCRGDFVREGTARVSNRGGKAGAGGLALFDAGAVMGESWVERSFRRVPEADGGFGFTGGPGFPSAVWADSVTEASMLELNAPSTGAAFPGSFEVRGELPGQVRVVNVVGGSGAPLRAMIPLFPGFNTLVARPTDGQEPLDDPAYGLLHRRVLTLNGLADCDADCQAVLANPYTENGVVRYLVGDGIARTSGPGPDGVEATRVGIRSDYPMRLAHGPDGSLYFTDRHYGVAAAGQVIRRVGPDGRIATIAGGGTNRADNIPATQARLAGVPWALSVGPDGTVCLLEGGQGGIPSRVLRVDPQGTLTTLVGGGLDSTVGAGDQLGVSVTLDANGGSVGENALGFDGAGNLYLPRFAWATFNPPGRGSFSNLVGVVSQVRPDGWMRTVMGGVSPQAGGYLPTTWSGRKALAAAITPGPLAVSRDGRIAMSTRGYVVEATLDDEEDYVLRNLSVLASPPVGDDGPADGRPVGEVQFAGAWALAYAPDGCLYGGNYVRGPTHSLPAIRKITPDGITMLVMGAGRPDTAVDGEAARFGGSFRTGCALSVGPDNRVIFEGAGGTHSRIAKVVQPFDAPLPFPDPPEVSFATNALVVWETNGPVRLPLVRTGYAGSVVARVDRVSGAGDVGSPLVWVTFGIEDTLREAVFVVSDRPGVQGPRVAEFEVSIHSQGGWVAPLTAPSLAARVGITNRLRLIILDDELPVFAPRLSRFAGSPGGVVRWEAIGIPGRSLVLQSTRDLVRWDDVGSHRSDSGWFEFSPRSMPGPTADHEFFRVMMAE
jgi:hypothetical protein